MSLARLERNAEAAFTIHETRDIRIQIHKQRSGPACYGLTAIQGSHPLSRYGIRTNVFGLTLGIAHDVPAKAAVRVSPI